MDTIKVGNFIKELRKEKNLSQEELLEVFMVSRRTVSRWETGGLRYNSDKLKKAL